MADILALPSWIKLDGAVGDLGALIPDVEALAQLAEKWKDIGSALFKLQHEAPVDDPVKLIAYLCDHADDAAVKAVFTQLGLDALQQKLAHLAQRISDPDAPFGKLLQPMSHYAALEPGDPDDATDRGFGFDPPGADGELSLKIPKLAVGAAPQIGPADITFNLAADASLKCEAGSPWPFAEDKFAGTFLRLGAEGHVSTKAGLSLPLGQYGAGTAHAGASGDAAISLFYQPDSADTPMGSVLARGLLHLPDPLDLKSLAGAMAVGGLGGIAIGCNGAVEAGAGLALGKSFDIPQLLSGKLGADASIDFRRDARWIVSLHRSAAGAFRFALRRADSSEREWAAGIGLNLDISPLAKKAHDLLAQVDGFIGGRLEAIKPFLSPGTYIANELSALLRTTAKSIIDDPAIRDAVVADLLTGLGQTSSDSSSLVDLLMDKIASHAGSVEKGIIADLDQWTGHVVDKLVRQIPSFAADGVEAFLGGHIKPLLADVQRRFEDRIGGLVSDAAVSAEVAQELSNLGTSVKAAERQADKLLAGVREVVGKYTAFMQEALKATEDVANSKISAHFGWSGSSSSGRAAELSGTISQINADTVQLWRDLVAGKLHKFQQIMSDPAQCPKGLTIDPQSRLSSFAAKQTGTALEVVLFGVELTMKTIVGGKARISVNAAGDIAVTAEGMVLRATNAFEEGRSVSFFSNWDLLQYKAQNAVGGRRAMKLGLNFGHDDKDLNLDEVTGVLQGLVNQGVIEQSRLLLAQNTWQDWRMATVPGAKVKGRIDIAMSLPAAAIDRMVAIGSLLVAKDFRTQASLFEAAALAQASAGVVRPARYRQDLDALSDNDPDFTEHPSDAARLAHLWNEKEPLKPRFNQQQDVMNLPALAEVVPRAGHLAIILMQMARIYNAHPFVASAPLADAWTEQQYAEAEYDLVKAAKLWLPLNQILFFKMRAAMSPVLVSFFRLMGTMCSPPQAGASPADGLAAPVDTALVNPLVRITMTSAGGKPVLI